MEPIAVLSELEIDIPLYMIVSYIGAISICLLLGRGQLGLALSFLFVFYIGYLYNRDLLLDTIKGSAVGALIYAGLGVIIIILTIISFVFSSKKPG